MGPLARDADLRTVEERFSLLDCAGRSVDDHVRNGNEYPSITFQGTNHTNYLPHCYSPSYLSPSLFPLSPSLSSPFLRPTTNSRTAKAAEMTPRK